MGRKSRKKKEGSQGPGDEAGAGGRKPDPSAPRPTKGGGHKTRRNPLVEWVKSLVAAFVLFLLLSTFVLHTFVIISESMEETLLVGDLILANRAAVGSRIPGTSWRIPGYSKLRRGDVVVFDPHHDEELMLVKRVMGLPGDTLEMRNKVLLVNGIALDEPYVQHTDLRDDVLEPAPWRAEALLGPPRPGFPQATRDTWGPLVVPQEHYFMMGDNRDTSLDSRYWGFLEEWRIEGRAVLIYFSYDRNSLRPFPWLSQIRWSRLGDGIR